MGQRLLAFALVLMMILSVLPGSQTVNAAGGMDISVKTAEELDNAIYKILQEGENGQENIIRMENDIDLSEYEYDLVVEKDTILLGQGHTLNLDTKTLTVFRNATLSLGKEKPQGNENVLKITSNATKDAPRDMSALSVGSPDPDILDRYVMIPGHLKMYDGVEITGIVTNGLYGPSAVMVYTGVFDMFGGKIHKNMNYLDKHGVGSAVFVDGGKDGQESVTFNMYGGEISDNFAKQGNSKNLLGGGITLRHASFTMTAGKIMNNQLEGREGAPTDPVYGTAINARDSQLTLKGANRDAILISGNKGAASGGAISLANSPLTAENATISDNESSLYGGALTTDGPVTLNNVLIKNNKSKQGGGIFLDDNAELICKNNTLFQGNMATENGGAIFDKNSVDQSDFNGDNYEELTANTDYYRGITMDNTTGFDQNMAESGLSVPPANWSDFSNLGYKQDPAFHNPTGIPSPLNNYDINYKNDFFFVAYDGNGAEGSMPTSAYKNG